MHLIGARRLVRVVVKAITVAENVAINCRCYLKRKDPAFAAGVEELPPEGGGSGSRG